jgi:hypothetical protein
MPCRAALLAAAEPISEDGGKISYQDRRYPVGKALRGQPLVLRPTGEDGILSVFFRHQQVKEIHLRDEPDE